MDLLVHLHFQDKVALIVGLTRDGNGLRDETVIALQDAQLKATILRAGTSFDRRLLPVNVNVDPEVSNVHRHKLYLLFRVFIGLPSVENYHK